MEHVRIDPAHQRDVTVTVDEELAAAVDLLGLDLSRIVDRAMAAEVKGARERQWRAENREAIQAWNAWLDKNGLPFERHRMF